MKQLSIRHRPRRLRRTDSVRRLARETSISIDKFIQPVFVCDGENEKQEIASMPGVYRFSADRIYKEIDRLLAVGISAILLFPKVDESLKDQYGSASQSEEFYLYPLITKLKQRYPQLSIATDVALDPYTSHGHDGLIDEEGHVLNDKTLPLLANMALEQAKAGADIVAPSDMMDGRVGYIRDLLDEQGFSNVMIMSYCVKYASSFYGPFRTALESKFKGDKKTYQMDTANHKEAVKEALLDVAEGADILLIKPASIYLDVVYRISLAVDLPIALYHVSGEYAMLKAAAANGWLDYEKCIIEVFQSFVRSGANIIISYAAYEVAKLLSQKSLNIVEDGKQVRTKKRKTGFS